jgi:hypothetical protein
MVTSRIRFTAAQAWNPCRPRVAGSMACQSDRTSTFRLVLWKWRLRHMRAPSRGKWRSKRQRSCERKPYTNYPAIPIDGQSHQDGIDVIV